MRGVEDLDEDLDILGQQPGLGIYTQICLCYHVAENISQQSLIDTFNTGLERLSASFPWISGQVINEGRNEANSGIFKIKPFGNIPLFVSKDLTDDSSRSFEALRRSEFAFELLDEETIAPRATLPNGSATTSPVFGVQANFVKDGLILTFVAQHQVMDMTGQYQMMYLFSKACRGEPFTEEEMSIGNPARGNLIALLDEEPYKKSNVAKQTIETKNTSANIHKEKIVSSPPTCSWAYFMFPQSSLHAIKSMASKSLTSGYVSTDDAVTAFVWQSVVRARMHRLDSKANSTFGRAVNVRHYLGIPANHPGIVQNMTYHAYTVEKLVGESLGAIASNLRSALQPETSKLEHETRAFATLLARSPDKTVASFVSGIDLSTGLMISSWAQVDCYNLDFGFGKPEAVRRPRFVPVESLGYFLPKTSKGDIALAICLRDEDMKGLKSDEIFTRYARYIPEGVNVH